MRMMPSKLMMMMRQREEGGVEEVVAGTQLAGMCCPLHRRGVGDANIRLKSVETNPQGILPLVAPGEPTKVAS